MSPFFESVKRRMPHFFTGADVLEYVPHTRSKSINYLFDNCRNFVINPKTNYLSNVEDDSFRVVMSIDYFQYTPEYLKQLKEMHRVSSKFVMFSCAAAGRHIEDPPPYYKNLVMSDFYNKIDLDSMFETYRFDVDYDRSDLYFWGVKK
jgi:ubiquinone/menaquinone biosynthesis C-methylase UbiE